MPDSLNTLESRIGNRVICLHSPNSIQSFLRWGIMDKTSAELMESLMFVAFTGREGTEDLAARGRSPEGGVKAKRGRILGGDDATMLFHWEESATTKTAPFRRNPLGAGGPPTYQTEAAGAPQALSSIVKAGHDERTAPAASVSNLGGRSSLRACNPKTPARGPQDFCHGLLRAHLNQAAEFEVSGTARICGHHPIKRVKPRGGDRV